MIPNIIKIFYISVIILLITILHGVYRGDVSEDPLRVEIPSSNHIPQVPIPNEECYKKVISQNYNLRAVKESFEIGKQNEKNM